MLSHAEEQARELIKNNDFPFLGLLGAEFTPEMRTAVDIAAAARSSAEGYAEFLDRFPALFAINLLAHVLEGLGQSGSFDVHPHVNVAIGVSQRLSEQERDEVWRAFRRALVKLGFEPLAQTQAPHRRANEYVRQTGVPLAFVADLAERMLSFEKRVGLPDLDDQGGLVAWQRSLEDWLEPPFSVTARKAVSWDTQAYYTRVFVRVYQTLEHTPRYGGRNALEVQMVKAILGKGEQGRRPNKAVLPCVVLNDGMLGVFLPGGGAREFTITTDRDTQRVYSGTEDRFLPLQHQLATVVEIQDIAAGQRNVRQLWVDAKSNRILVFGDRGRLVSGAQLGQAEPLELDPGVYSVVSRFAPTGVDTEVLWDVPALFGFTFDLSPGGHLQLQNGPAILDLRGKAQPRAVWAGASRSSREGTEYFFGDIEFRLEIPDAWKGIAAHGLTLNVADSALGGGFSLPLAIGFDGSGRASLTQGMDAADWLPGLTRTVVEVTRVGERRALVRSSALVWRGLQAVDGRALVFQCRALPTNLDYTLCDNLRVDDLRLVPADAHARSLRMTFRIGDRRHITLTWNAPGIFIEVHQPTEGGETLVNRKLLGSTEVISSASTKLIVVTASDAATLSLGDWALRVDFRKSPVRRLSAAFLASRLLPGRSALTFRYEMADVEQQLLTFSQPHWAGKPMLLMKSESFVIRVDTKKVLEAVTVRAKDVLHGRTVEVTLRANHSDWARHVFGSARLIVHAPYENKFRSELEFNSGDWPGGAWVFEIDGLIDGLWGHLENDRGDIVACALIIDDDAAQVPAELFLEGLAAVPDEVIPAVLARVQTALLPCYSAESWELLAWLLPTWRQLLERCMATPDKAIPQLVDCALAKPPAEANASWLLQTYIGAAKPEVFALPARLYRRAHSRNTLLSDGIKMLGVISSMSAAQLCHEHFHGAVAAGFSNVAAFSRGARPAGFTLNAYAKALAMTHHLIEDGFKLDTPDYRPGDSEFLGPCHYKHAMRCLETMYERTLGGNEIRGRALALNGEVRRQASVLRYGTGSLREIRTAHINPWPRSAEAPVTEEQQTRDDILSGFANSLSVLAFKCRIGAREPAVLKAFLANLQKSPDLRTEQCLTYLLQIGEGVFAYYLMLWEFLLTLEDQNA